MFPVGVVQQQILGGGGSSSLLTDLVSWWSLDETTGTRVDSHGSNDLTPEGTTNYESAKVNNGCVCNGSDAKYFKLSPSGINTGLNSWTIAGWVKITSTASLSAIAVLCDSSVASNSNIGFMLDHRTNKFTISLYTASTRRYAQADSFGTTSTGVYYFVHAYFDSTIPQLGISINNGAIDTGAVSGTPNSKSAAFGLGRLGYSGANANWFNGAIDEIAFWNRLLTTDEVTQLYSSGSGMAYPV